MQHSSIIAERAGQPLADMQLDPASVQTYETGHGRQFSTIAPGALLSGLPSENSNGAMALPAEIAQRLNETTDAHNYRYPRTYALRDGKISFIYEMRRANGVSETVIFERGLFATTDIEICQAIEADIKRSGGISHTVMNITTKEMLSAYNAARAYQVSAAATRGAVSSEDINITKKRYEAESRQQAEALRILTGQHAELTAKNAAMEAELARLRAQAIASKSASSQSIIQIDADSATAKPKSPFGTKND